MFSQRERRLPASAGEKSVATVSLFIGIAIGALGGGDGTFKRTSTCSVRGAGAVILRFSGAVPSVEDTSKSLSSVKSTATRFGLSLVFVSSIMSRPFSHIVYGNRVLQRADDHCLGANRHHSALCSSRFYHAARYCSSKRAASPAHCFHARLSWRGRRFRAVFR